MPRKTILAIVQLRCRDPRAMGAPYSSKTPDTGNLTFAEINEFTDNHEGELVAKYQTAVTRGVWKTAPN